HRQAREQPSHDAQESRMGNNCEQRVGRMVIYKSSVSAPAVTGVPSITGAYITIPPSTNTSDPLTGLCAWQPSTWPAAPSKWNADLVPVLRKIFKESILD